MTNRKTKMEAVTCRCECGNDTTIVLLAACPFEVPDMTFPCEHCGRIPAGSIGFVDSGTFRITEWMTETDIAASNADFHKKALKCI